MSGVRVATALFCVLAGFILSVSMAGAAYDPLDSGASKLTLDKTFLNGLKRSGVVVSAVAPARMRGATVTLPVSGGKFDPTTSKGAVKHDGAIVFRAGNHGIPLPAGSVF